MVEAAQAGLARPQVVDTVEATLVDPARVAAVVMAEAVARAADRKGKSRWPEESQVVAGIAPKGRKTP
jgi:hypothetical protein